MRVWERFTLVAVELSIPGEDHSARRKLRRWLAEHPSPSPRDLAESGYVAPYWPRPWGLGAGAVEQLVIDDELRRAGVRRPSNQIGIGWAGPTIIHAGTEEQKQRYLFPLLAGEELWCQLFSEPGAGSDLASLSTRATRDGDEWVVEGHKVWASFAHEAAFGILLARTDPDAEKHSGISYFICPMDARGVTVRPIVDMTAEHVFNEVFFDGVHLPRANLVGDVNKGWALAKITLSNERVSLSGEGALWGQGPTAQDLVDLVRERGGTNDPQLRDRLARVWAEGEILRLIRLRTVGATLSGRAPGPEASVRKALADDHGQRVMELAMDLAGAWSMLADAGPADGLRNDEAGSTSAGRSAPRRSGLMVAGAGWGTDSKTATGMRWPSDAWVKGYLFARALTIGGGTAEVQRNIIAERVLGLPADPGA